MPQLGALVLEACLHLLMLCLALFDPGSRLTAPRGAARPSGVMPDFLSFLLSHGSIALVVLALIVAGLGVPVPEDIMLLAAGVLVHRGEVSYAGALAACAVGVMVGDTFIFLLARRLGPSALERRPLNLLVTPVRRERIERMFEKYGNVIVFMARHMAGLRAPTFAMAGMHNMPLSKFWLWDGLGLCVSAPVVIGIGYWLADNLDRAQVYLQKFELVILGAIFVAAIAFFIWRRLRRSKPAHEH
jgi:membrane protein DedA with SNARE-associated domain